MRLALAAAVIALTGCQSIPADAPRATAQLRPTQGHQASGEATFRQVGDKVRVVLFAQGLMPNREHGFHVHEAGDCSAPDAMSAKGHFNPFGKPHGAPTSGERHAGDMPAIRTDSNGHAKLEATLDTMAITPGPASIVGRGLIIHADPDDYKTQPTGNAGARIACGIIQRG